MATAVADVEVTVMVPACARLGKVKAATNSTKERIRIMSPRTAWTQRVLFPTFGIPSVVPSAAQYTPIRRGRSLSKLGHGRQWRLFTPDGNNYRKQPFTQAMLTDPT